MLIGAQHVHCMEFCFAGQLHAQAEFETFHQQFQEKSQLQHNYCCDACTVFSSFSCEVMILVVVL